MYFFRHQKRRFIRGGRLIKSTTENQSKNDNLTT